MKRLFADEGKIVEVEKEEYKRTFEDMAKRYITLEQKMEEVSELIDKATEELYEKLEITKLSPIVEKEEKQLKSMLARLEEQKKTIDGWELKLVQSKRESFKAKDFIEKLIEKFSEIKPEYKDMITLMISEFTTYPDLTDLDNLKINLKKEKKVKLARQAAFADNFKNMISKFVGWLKDKWDAVFNKVDKKYDEIEKIMQDLENSDRMVIKKSSLKKKAGIESVSEEDFKAFVKVQYSGVTNMFDAIKVEELSGLSRKKQLEIHNNYGELMKKYPEVIKGGSLNRKATSYTDFLMNYGDEIKEAIKQLKEINKIYDSISKEVLDKAHEKVANIYDKNVSDYIEYWEADGDVTADDIARLGLENQDRWGTEANQILSAIDDFYNVIMRNRKESSLNRKAIRQNLVKKVNDALNEENVGTDEASPNIVNKIANEIGIDNLTSEEVVYISDNYKKASLNKEADAYNPYMYTSPTNPSSSDGNKSTHKKYMVKFKETDGSWRFSTMEDDLETAKAQAQQIYNDEKKKAKVIDTTSSNILFVIGLEHSNTFKRNASLNVDVDKIGAEEHKKNVEGLQRTASHLKVMEADIYSCQNCHLRLGRFIKKLPESCPRCGHVVKFEI